MPEIARASAFANNEIAFLAWALDADPLPGCLGFHIVREHLDGNDRVVEERPLASYVAFKGQRNPDWLAQNTTVWPVQKFTWRDLTLRRRRDSASLRPEAQRVRWRIAAVGDWHEGLEKVEVVESSHREPGSGRVVVHTYQGKPRPLGYLTAFAHTNIVDVTATRGPFTSTFTNGVLSTQFLAKVLNEDGKVEDGELERHLRTPGDLLREYLSGDVIATLRAFFEPPEARFYAALYELEDTELEALLAKNAQRLHLILSDAGSGEDDEGEATYDTRNAPARARLAKLNRAPGNTFELHNRLFNGTGHIGHHKFIVRVDANGDPEAVLTGSTNWTYSGVAGQSNNCIVIRERAVAAQFLAEWKRLRADRQPTPRPLSARNTGAGQGDALKRAHVEPARHMLDGGGEVQTWFSPNVPGKNQPPSGLAALNAAPPPDMASLFALMRRARQAIFFLVFMPSRGGLNSIVSEAVALGQRDPSLIVHGAISDTQAMWGYIAGGKDESGKKTSAFSPHVFKQGGVSVVRATALADRKLLQELGDFKFAEQLTVGRAIIHDKILVLDPMDPMRCTVAFGSHNLGYKASYANDENLVVVRGQQALALAYAAHVLDVYDHYRFRAVEMAKRKKETNLGANKKAWSGFLDTSDAWQAKASRRLARYFTEPALP